jgi:hypothetical protein
VRNGAVAGAAADPVPDARQRRAATGGGTDPAAGARPSGGARARPPPTHGQDPQRPPARRRAPPEEDHLPLAQASTARQGIPKGSTHRLHHPGPQVLPKPPLPNPGLGNLETAE